MAYLTKKEVEKILQEAPAGTTPGGIIAALRKQGHQLEGYAEQNRQDPNQDPTEKGLIEKVVFGLGDFTGVTKLGQGIAAAINAPRNEKLRTEQNTQANRIRDELTAKIIQNRKEGKDTTRLERALAQHNEANRIFNADITDMSDQGVSNRDVIGSAVRTAGTIASFGTYGTGAAALQTGKLGTAAVVPRLTKATGIIRGAVDGAKAGAKIGAKGGSIFGALQSLGLGIQDETAGIADIAAKTAGGAVLGGVTGGAFGAILGSFTGGIQARQNFRAQLEKNVAGSNAPYVERIKRAANETAKEIGDDQGVRVAQVKQSIRSSEALPIEKAIKAGDVAEDAIYSDPANKILTPEFATGRIDDVKLKLNRIQPGLGDRYAQGINPANTTYDDIIKKGLDSIDEIQRPGIPNADTALYKLDAKGKVIGDVDAKQLVKATGLEPADVAMMKSGTAADKAAYKRMLDAADEVVANPSAGAKQRPEAIVGKTAHSKIKLLRKAKNDAGAEINKVVRTQLADKKLNTQKVYEKWVASLADDGVKVADDGKLVFKGSRYEDVKSAQNLLKTAHKKALQLNKTNVSAVKAHNFKAQLDEVLDFGNNQETGLSGQASRLAKGLRVGIDDQLDNTFGVYNKANIKYRDAATSLERIDAILQKKYVNGSDELLQQRLGTILRRLYGNAPETAIDLTNSIDDGLVKLGVDAGEDTITNQAYFSTIVNQLYPTRRNSLAGQVALGNAQKFKGLRNFANNPIGTTGNAALDIVENSGEVKTAVLRKYVESLLK